MPTLILKGLSRRLHRLKRNYDDLVETSGSRVRALLYLAKYVANGVRYIVPHARLSIEGSAVRADVIKSISEADTPLVAMKLTGGVGDLLIAARYIRDLLASTEPVRFDVYCKNPALAQWVFGSFPQFRRAHLEFLFDLLRREYSLAFWMTQFVIIYSETTDWRTLRELPRLTAALDRIMKARRHIEPIVQAHPYLDCHMSQIALFAGKGRRDFLHSMSQTPYGGDRLALAIESAAIEKHGLQRGRYITIHNGYDPDFVITAKHATKCYRRFADVVRLCKKTLPGLQFVQIGTSTSEPIAGVDVDLIGKTTMQEAAALVKDAVLHVDNESGLVHLASCFDTRALVIFGPTPESYFAYPTNINLSPPSCGGCWWIRQTWMDQCPRGDVVPRCMDHEPDTIAEKIVAAVLFREGQPERIESLQAAGE